MWGSHYCSYWVIIGRIWEAHIAGRRLSRDLKKKERDHCVVSWTEIQGEETDNVRF